jgi:WhiB family redox-sensing transcriptional regulator
MSSGGRGGTVSMSTLVWMSRGACHGEDTGLFFPDGESGSSVRQIEQARAICRRCPVCASCLRYAMDTRQHGIWGATTDDERRAIRQTARRHSARRSMAVALS